MSNEQIDVKGRVRKLISKLNEEERKLLVEVLKLENQNLHLKQPSLKQPILKKVRELLK